MQSKISHQNFLFLGGDSDNLLKYKQLISEDNVNGVQIVYTWRSLEPKKDTYDFVKIEHDLAFLNALHRKVFIQIQDRFFEPHAKYVPNYLMQEPEYTEA